MPTVSDDDDETPRDIVPPQPGVGHFWGRTLPLLVLLIAASIGFVITALGIADRIN